MIKTLECLECKSTKDIHQHHVIPRIMGGTVTVPLCAECHGKIHNLNFRDHSILVKKGLKKAKKEGKILGRPSGSVVEAKDLILKHPDVAMLLMDKVSIRKSAKISGKSASTVQRVKKQLESINFKFYE